MRLRKTIIAIRKARAVSAVHVHSQPAIIIITAIAAVVRVPMGIPVVSSAMFSTEAVITTALTALPEAVQTVLPLLPAPAAAPLHHQAAAAAHR